MGLMDTLKTRLGPLKGKGADLAQQHEGERKDGGGTEPQAP
ncbi:hypothetical protein FHS39_004825 [Streptomyces olivoverticillatus]|uniref:Antitoxin n=1 Tax=Streptomyces olivoverticillatus TaxID=66427 RepID=A0A7W7PLW0_9ACTN|nr:hypothetical protein [Streptomyces olivoverticillatus]MBB4895746.1 hypothetical protein [Streptomyces olivoverticillatus]